MEIAVVSYYVTILIINKLFFKFIMRKRMRKIVYAPAKVNLVLEVVGKRKDGYHLLRTVMLKLEKLQDKLDIQIKENNQTEIILKCNQKEIPCDERNICHKAVKLFLEKINKKAWVKINLFKKIPSGAGLGGGSSDGAVVLSVLNSFFGFPLKESELNLLASQIGKDLPFFLLKKETAQMTGLGDELEEEFFCKSTFFILLIKPTESVSTAMAYSGLVEKIWFLKNKEREDFSGKMTSFLKKKNNQKIWDGKLFNDFELTIEQQLPIIKELKQSLLVFGAEASLMSGSGSTVFGVFSSLEKLKKAEKILKKHYPNFFVVRGR